MKKLLSFVVKNIIYYYYHYYYYYYYYYYYLPINKQNFFFVKHIKMVNLTTYELRLIARKRAIKNYGNMSREKLLSSFEELECNFKTLSEKRVERITKMQNF